MSLVRNVIRAAFERARGAAAVSERVRSARSRRAERARIAGVLARHRELQAAAIAVAPQLWCGPAAPDQLAKCWQRMGFSAAQVEEWLSAGCALPFAAAGLRASYISSQLAAQQTDRGDGPPATIGSQAPVDQAQG